VNKLQKYLQSIRDIINSPRITTFIQIGSNVGDKYIFDLIIEKKINLVIFIDANINALQECKKNQENYFLNKKITWDIKFDYINCAISNINAPKINLNIPTEHINSAHGSIFEDFPTLNTKKGFKSIEVDNFSINDIFNEYKLKVIDYLFIDVEGCDKGIVNSLRLDNNLILNLKFEFAHWEGWQGYDSPNLKNIIFVLLMNKYKIYQSSATDISADRILNWKENYKE
jgi:FkbM family methyltransferase